MKLATKQGEQSVQMWRNKRKSENSEIFMEWQELRRKVPNVCNWDDGCLPFLNKRFNNSFNKK